MRFFNIIFLARNDIIPCGPLPLSGQFATHQFCLGARCRGLGGHTFDIAALEHEIRIRRKLSDCKGVNKRLVFICFSYTTFMQ